MITQSQNEVLLEGVPLSEPEKSHENHGMQFYRFFLEAPRLSGKPDTLPVLLPKSMTGQVHIGVPIRIKGQMRSFNNRSGIGHKLVLAIYAMDIQPGLGEACNQIILSGALCKQPVFRRTPLGRSICDLMLAVPRRYGRADYLPVIAWGQLAVRVSQLTVGNGIALEGRVQSRSYQKVTEEGTQERIAYEVSMMRLMESED